MLTPWLLTDSFDPARGLEYRRLEPSNPSNLAVEGIRVSTLLWTASATLKTVKMLISTGAFHTNTPNRSEYISHSTITTMGCTFSAGRDAYGALEKDRSLLASHFAAWIIAEMGQQSEAPGKSKVEVDNETLIAASKGDEKQFQRLFEIVCEGRCLFVTVGGHLGLGPSSTEAGDVLCVLGGAKCRSQVVNEATLSNLWANAMSTIS
jgi:hypothetical protein